MKLPNLKKYANFDEYLKRNDIEILSFNDGIVARWKWSRRYKSWGHRVTETITSQMIGNNYEDLTKKLKKELLKLYRLPGILIFGAIMGILMFLQGISTDETIFIFFGLFFGIASSYFVVIEVIELRHAKKILKSESLITHDYVKTKLNWMFSLFHDVYKNIENNQQRTDGK
jgi:hypothetical protein